MTKLMKGEVALVTGGASGIGKAACKTLASHGAKVIIVDINKTLGEKLAAEINGQEQVAHFIQANIANEQEVKLAVEKALRKYGKITSLCNNVGIGARKKVHETPVDEWDNVHNINLKSVFLFSKYTIPSMIEAGGGNIVNISSIHAEATQKGYSVYASTKGGINALTRGMAIDYAADNIRVNAILPGCILTEEVIQSVEDDDNPDELRELIDTMQPMNRPGQPEEVANLILFLLTASSSFITGSTYRVDGGLLARSVH